MRSAHRQFVVLGAALLAALAMTNARTLDALHLAAAQRLGGSAVGFVTFDVRQGQAARALGMTVLPG